LGGSERSPASRKGDIPSASDARTAVKADRLTAIRALNKVRRKRPTTPSVEDPIVELRRLTQMHAAWTKKSTAIDNMSSDRVNKETKEVIPCDVPLDVRAQMKGVKDALKREASALESAMLRELKKIPIYQLWLSKVFAARGPVLSAYLVSKIDIRKATKPSNLKRYCGLAVIDGRLERRKRGVQGSFNHQIRTRLYQLFQVIKKGKRLDPENKYLKIWNDAKNRIQHSDRVTDRGLDAEGKWTGKIETGGKVVSARGFADSYGWHKAADRFVEDLYIVWRSVEGLEVWPNYYAGKLARREHVTGKPVFDEPKMLTVDEAIALVSE
jgi:hypothetical protein